MTKNWLICNSWRIINFRTKILSEGPYLKSFISRVLCSYRERFCSFSRYAIRLRVEPYFLAALHRAVGTIAVKIIMWLGLLFSFYLRCLIVSPNVENTVVVNIFKNYICLVWKFKNIIYFHKNNRNVVRNQPIRGQF